MTLREKIIAFKTASKSLQPLIGLHQEGPDGQSPTPKILVGLMFIVQWVWHPNAQGWHSKWDPVAS